MSSPRLPKRNESRFSSSLQGEDTMKWGLHGLIFSLALVALAACNNDPQDAASEAGLGDNHFVHADENYFHAMDNGVALTRAEVQGRNMWLVWTGGNDRFWDYMNKPTLGGFDLLKIVAPDPSGPNRRDNRWHQLGLVNEPCF